MSEVHDSFEETVLCTVQKFRSALGAYDCQDLNLLADHVNAAFQSEAQLIQQGYVRPKPNDRDLQVLTAPLYKHLGEIVKLREANRHGKYANHFATVAESILALNWITMQPTPVPFIRDMKEAGDYFGNRVLTADKGTRLNEMHVQFINTWNSIIAALEEYVRVNHATGFRWGCRSTQTSNISRCPPPPPLPPVEPAMDYYPAGDACNPPLNPIELAADRQQLMVDICRGEDIVRMLRPVNRAPIQFPAPVLQRAGGASGQRPAAGPVKPPVFVLEGRKWRVEFQMNMPALELTPTDKAETLAVFKCENTSLETKAKMNTVTIDNCKRCVITLQHIITSVELIRCERVEVRCIGSCPNVTVDSCDSVQVFLNSLSAECEVITSKSTSINVCRMTSDGDYVEYPVPEQIRCRLDGNKLQASVVQHFM